MPICLAAPPVGPPLAFRVLPQTLTTMGNPVVYFDMTIGGAPAGRIEMTLRADVVPKTADVRRLDLRAFPRSPRDNALCIPPPLVPFRCTRSRRRTAAPAQRQSQTGVSG